MPPCGWAPHTFSIPARTRPPTVRELTGGAARTSRSSYQRPYHALREAIRVVGPDGTVVASGFYQGEATALRLGEEFHHNRVQLVASQIGSVPDRCARAGMFRGCSALSMRRSPTGRLDVLASSAIATRSPMRPPPTALLDDTRGRAAGRPGVRVNATACQEQHLPGDSLEEKFGAADGWGFDGIELRGEGTSIPRPAARTAAGRANGVVMPTACVEMSTSSAPSTTTCARMPSRS